MTSDARYDTSVPPYSRRRYAPPSMPDAVGARRRSHYSEPASTFIADYGPSAPPYPRHHYVPSNMSEEEQIAEASRVSRQTYNN